MVNRQTDTSIASPFKAWIIWLLSAFFMFYKFALEVSPSVMNADLMKAFKIGGVELGNLAASYFYAYLLLQIPAGLLIDKIGPRKVTTAAIILCAFGSLLFATADSLLMASLGRFLTGAGAAFAVVNCLKLVSNWFPLRQFAFITGLQMTIAMLGAVGGLAPLAAFIEAVEWRHAMQIISGVGFVLAVVFWFVVRDRAPEHTREKHIVSVKVSFFESIKRLLKNRQSWWLSVYSGFTFAPVMIFGGLWGVAYTAEAFALPNNIAAQAVSLIFIGFAVGAPVFGWLSDWLRRRRIVIFWGTLLAFLSISAVIYVPSMSYFMLNLLLFIFGFAIGSYLLSFSMIREINVPGLAATAVGFMNAFNALFGAFSDPLTGLFLDMGWDGKLVDGARVFSVFAYKIAFITIPVYLIIALLSLLKIKETYGKHAEPSSLP